MTRYVALLRAVNLGGHNMLPMTELRSMCERLGFENARTYIASGNVVFSAKEDELSAKKALEAEIERFAGKKIDVFVRTAAEMAAISAANPFPEAKLSNVLVFFLDDAPAPDTHDHATGRKDEEISLGTREIYIHYPEGMGRSRLKIKGANGTGRNVNTVAKLAALTADVS